MIAVSVLSGAHNLLIPDVIDRLRSEGIDPSAVPIVVGGVIPDEDAAKLEGLGVARVFTPRDYDITANIGEMADLIDA
jgi:(2R)-ethylmalonyl-CoA mutase